MLSSPHHSDQRTGPSSTASGPAGDTEPVVNPPATSSQVRTGRCECGHITYEVSGIPDDPHLCSCRHEKRISGGPTVLWVGFPKNTLAWTGPGGDPAWYATFPTLHRGFCPRCGSHLISIADDSDMIMVTGFSLDDRSGTAPMGHSFREEAVPRMTITLAADSRASQPASS